MGCGAKGFWIAVGFSLLSQGRPLTLANRGHAQPVVASEPLPREQVLVIHIWPKRWRARMVPRPGRAFLLFPVGLSIF